MTGAIVARMDDEQRLPRLGPVDRGRPRRHAHHQQVAGRRAQGRRQDAAASRTSGLTSCVTYDGSGKAAGVQVYVNGEPQPIDVAGRQADRARSAPTVPLKIGQRQRRRPARRRRAAGPADLRPALDAGRGRAARPRPRAAAELLAKPADKRTPAENDELFDWWLATLDEPYRDADAKLGGARSRRRPTSRPAAPIAHVMQEKPERADGVHPVPRRVRQAPRPGEGRHARRRCRRCRPTCREPPRPRPVAAAAGAPADGPRHGQPLLAGGLRHRPRPHDRRLRRHRRAAVAPRAARLAGGRVPRDRAGT